jgi:hypothetical protein
VLQQLEPVEPIPWVEGDAQAGGHLEVVPAQLQRLGQYLEQAARQLRCRPGAVAALEQERELVAAQAEDPGALGGRA